MNYRSSHQRLHITVENLKGNMRLLRECSIKPGNLDGRVRPDRASVHIRIAVRFDALKRQTGDGIVDTRVLRVRRWKRSGRSGPETAVDLVLPPISDKYDASHRRRQHR